MKKNKQKNNNNVILFTGQIMQYLCFWSVFFNLLFFQNYIKAYTFSDLNT